MAYLLIVDDDEDFANATATVFKSSGYEVKIELDTKTALAAIKKKRPDLVLLDVMFPEDPGAGFELARILRDDTVLKEVPLLMLTAINTKFPLGFGPNDIDDAWLPVMDFLEKPVDLDVLLQKVDAILSKAESD